jgi:large subunit ribosomal protein L21
MYAIIRTGGKQYTVRAGDTVRVEKLPRELGSEFLMDEILLVGGDKVHVGEPTVKNAKVTVVVTQQAKAPKVIVFKKKRRQGYRRLQGHRQLFTELFVKSIHSPSGEVSEAEKVAQVIDPVKKAEKMERLKAEAKTKLANKEDGKKGSLSAKSSSKKSASAKSSKTKNSSAKKKSVVKTTAKKQKTSK